MNGLYFHNLTRAHVPHAVTTRTPGASSPPNQSFNLAFHAGDAPEHVRRNRGLISAFFSVSPDSLFFPEQVHGTDVITILDQSSLSIGSTPADALVTRRNGILIGVLTADCYPVLLSGGSGEIVAAVHAGRVGIQNGILQHTVSTMCSHGGVRPSDLLAGVGPGICTAHYPVDETTARSFTDATRGYYRQQFDDDCRAFNLDLRATIHAVLVRSGIRRSHIEHMALCTYEHPDIFFSHRFSRGHTGRFGAVIRRPDPVF
jgi:polyphenol oxidase